MSTPSPRTIVWLFRAAFSDWNEDRASRLAAALAYYATISLAPLLIILLGVAGLAFGPEAAAGQLRGQIQDLIGPQSAEVVQEIIRNANIPTAGIVSSVLGIIILLLGASGVFGSLQDGLNTVWEVTQKPDRGITGIIRDRFLSLTMVLGVGFLLLVSLVISALLAGLGEHISGILPLPLFLLNVINAAVSFVVISLLFALIYKVLPDVEIGWGDVWIGATITSLLFTIGKFVIGLYLGRSSLANAYGAAGSLVIILIWIYYSAQILFFGAELTQVYANSFGSHIRPASNALSVVQNATAGEGDLAS
jgi:membrane protein